jgi:AcrR family transcriptional regulator
MPESIGAEAWAPSPRKERTRRRILDAAGLCFQSRGYAKTTVAEIASQADVSKALVYRHFSGKEGILDSVLERTLADWNDATRLESMLTETGGVLEGISHMLRTSLAFAREHPVLRGLLELDTHVLAGSDAGRTMRSQMTELRASLREAVAAGVLRGELRDDLDVERAAEIILINHLAFVHHVLDPEWVDVSDDGLLDVGLDILVRGLQRTPK